VAQAEAMTSQVVKVQLMNALGPHAVAPPKLASAGVAHYAVGR
jgi:hypothetical protein